MTANLFGSGGVSVFFGVTVGALRFVVVWAHAVGTSKIEKINGAMYRCAMVELVR